MVAGDWQSEIHTNCHLAALHAASTSTVANGHAFPTLAAGFSCVCIHIFFLFLLPQLNKCLFYDSFMAYFLCQLQVRQQSASQWRILALNCQKFISQTNWCLDKETVSTQMLNMLKFLIEKLLSLLFTFSRVNCIVSYHTYLYVRSFLFSKQNI